MGPHASSALVLRRPSCNPGAGSRIREILPEDQTRARTRDATGVSETDARPTVLVVEDDAVIRHAAVELIVEAGFTVREATNGNEAIRILDQEQDAGGAVCVVVTDIDMPLGIDGIKLAACIHRRWPEIGIVITSGKVRPKEGDVPAQGRFVRKPYTEEQVIGAIRAVLSGR